MTTHIGLDAVILDQVLEKMIDGGLLERTENGVRITDRGKAATTEDLQRLLRKH